MRTIGGMCDENADGHTMDNKDNNEYNNKRILWL